MSNVVAFTPRATDAFQADAIAMLERKIAQIKAGDLKAVGISVTYTGGEMGAVWCGWSGDLIGPVQFLNARLVEDVRSTCT